MKSERYWQVDQEANISLPIHLLIRPEYLQTFRFHSNLDLKLVFQVNLAYPVRITEPGRILNLSWPVEYGHRLKEVLSPEFSFMVKGHHFSAPSNTYHLSKEECAALALVKRCVYELYLSANQRTGKETLAGLEGRFEVPLVWLSDLVPNLNIINF
jgi:hypothetical protein